jgi:N-carbamoyl-L-amino-acid hydrolase
LVVSYINSIGYRIHNIIKVFKVKNLPEQNAQHTFRKNVQMILPILIIYYTVLPNKNKAKIGGWSMEPLLTVNLSRLIQTVKESAKIGAIPGGGLCRLSLTMEDKEIRDLLKEWMIDAGLQVRVDDFGNMYGRREGKSKNAPVVMIGSHLDTQPEGGIYDGILGVLSALEVIKVLNENDIVTERPIEIVNFTNEEGARFEPPMLGSGGVAGIFSEDYVRERKDQAGKRFGDELQNIGYAGTPANRAENIYRFIELHIEQGPILEKEKIPIGAVNGVQGMNWLEVVVSGNPGHAGTVPMDQRKDALMSAAKMALAIQHIAKETDESTKVTIGRIQLKPGSTNCIPHEVVFSIDIRHPHDDMRERVVELVRERISTIALLDRIDIQIKDLWEIKSTLFSEDIVQLVQQGAKEHGYTCRVMMSGAGHDAKYIHHLAPSGMIFVPSVNGKSHCKEELTHWEDVEKGANVLLYVVQKLANKEEGDLNEC